MGGLTAAALSLSLMIEARLGLDPWNALHEGPTHYLPVSFGAVPTSTSLAVRAVLLVVTVVLRGAVGAFT